MMLTDQSEMPFGVHRCKAMEKVPASYLLWLWEDEKLWESPESHTVNQAAVYDYIVRNFNALETDCPDKIITHRP